MTPTEYLNTNPTIEDMRQHWGVMNAALKDALLNLQDQLGSNFRVSPIELTDGTWALNCDIFSDTSNGVYKNLFQALNMEMFDQAEIKHENEVLPLIPQPEEII
jgi:hypothetical protein